MMKQTWRKPTPEQIRRAVNQKPTYIPLIEAEAREERCGTNTTKFMLQFIGDMMLLMLHEEFGFGRKRCMRAQNAIAAMLAQWEEEVNEEIAAETTGMRFKERMRHRMELTYPWIKMDRALQPLVDPEQWVPYTERYRKFGGSGAWCD